MVPIPLLDKTPDRNKQHHSEDSEMNLRRDNRNNDQQEKITTLKGGGLKNIRSKFLTSLVQN